MITPAYTILAIDGGGIRGIIPGKILAYLEARLADLAGGEGPRVAEVFDLVAGTSTGGILACGLNAPDENGRPRYRAAELLDLYQGETGQKIFAQPEGLGRITQFFGSLASRAKFPAGPLEEVLRAYLGDARLSQACTDLLITAYNTEAKRPFYFKSSDCRRRPDVEDFPLWEIARATSAAPTYFPPCRVDYSGTLKVLDQDFQLLRKQLTHLSLVDGGVFANNPAMLAYIEAIAAWRLRRQLESRRTFTTRGMTAEVAQDSSEVPFFMLSLGTGETGTPYPYEEVMDWGLIEWVRPLIDILMQGVSESVDYQMRHLLPPYDDQEATPRYLRFNVELEPDHAALDDASEAHTSRLAGYADRLVQSETNRAKLDRAVELLWARYQARQAAREE